MKVPGVTTSDSPWRIRRGGLPGITTVDPLTELRSVTITLDPRWRISRWVRETSELGDSTVTSRSLSLVAMRGSTGLRPINTTESRFTGLDSKPMRNE